MTVTDLYMKYENSGIDGNPVITTEELIDLKNRIYDVIQFMNHHSVRPSLLSEIERIDSFIWARTHTL